MYRVVEKTFQATPIGENTPQLFRAVYEVMPSESMPGWSAWKLVHGTLTQLTFLIVIESSVADDAIVPTAKLQESRPV